MFKKKRSNTSVTFSKDGRTVFDNRVEPKRDHNKKFYGVIDFKDNKQPSVIVDYVCAFRSEAVAIFSEEARLMGGKLGVVSVFK